MTYKSEILLGRITKVSGYEGTVVVKLEKVFIENIPRIESVFLEIEGRPVPFFVSEWEYSGSYLLKLKFEGYETLEKVSEFAGCRVFLTSATNIEEEVADIQTILGFQVFISRNELLGSVSEIIPNPGQWLMSITSVKNKEILIPYHENFIVHIDYEKRIVIMDIPDGLTDLN